MRKLQKKKKKTKHVKFRKRKQQCRGNFSEID